MVRQVVQPYLGGHFKLCYCTYIFVEGEAPQGADYAVDLWQSRTISIRLKKGGKKKEKEMNFIHWPRINKDSSQLVYGIGSLDVL